MDRPNTQMAAIVDKGLAMSSKAEAVSLLAKHKVPDRVIARVLSNRAEPSQRRGRTGKVDWPTGGDYDLVD